MSFPRAPLPPLPDPRPNPLPLRIGFAGPSGRLEPHPGYRAEKRHREWFSSMHVRGLHAHAFQFPEYPKPEDAEVVAATAAQFDVELHAFNSLTHPLRLPEYRSPVKPYAARSVLARRALNAAAWGARSFTYLAGPRDAYDLQGVANEAGFILDILKSTPAPPRLRLMNAPSSDWWLSTAQAVLDFAREQPGLGATIHLGHSWQTDLRSATVDDLRGLLRQAPEDTLWLYANMGEADDPFGVRPFLARPNAGGAGSSGATPEVRPFLDAVKEEGRRVTLLVQGAKPEKDALEVLAEACRVCTVDGAALLESRQGFAMRPRDREELMDYG